MPSAYVCKAFNNFSYFNQRFETTPIQWDIKKKKFRHTSDHKKLFIWKVNCFLSMGIGLGAVTYILLREIVSPTNSLSIFFLLVQIALLTFGSLWIAMAACSLVYGKEYVYCWNESAKFLDRLREQSTGKMQ